jgi:hypothetical protein
VTFRLVLAPAGRGIEYRDQPVDWVWESTPTNSTTISWLTGVTQGSGLYTQRLVVDSDVAMSWIRSVSAPEDASTPRSISQCLVALHIFGKTDNATGVPQMYGAYAAEFVGAT